jgi:hypothetical protein
MYIERYIMEKETNGHLYILNDNIVRIADALEEILRLVKEDQERSKKYMEEPKPDLPDDVPFAGRL